MTKTIVLGLDGANWRLLEPWLKTGELPNLSDLREHATWGPLISQLPPVTSPNWRCYATGRNPAKLGVFWWEIVDREQHRIRHPTSLDFHTLPMWYDLAEKGKRVAVLNFPSGYPPALIPNGYFTAGGPGAKDSGFAYPSAWESELIDRYNYRVHPIDILHNAEQVELKLDEILSIMQSRFDVAFDLLGRGLDFLHITIFYINVLHHFWYRGEPTRAGWKLIDRNLGRLRKITEKQGYNLLLMSDHGCGPVNTVFYVNTWLEQEGYLHTTSSATASRLSRLGISRDRLIGLARRSGLAPLLRRLIPKRLQRALPSAGGTFDKAAKAERIDWKRSLAIASGQGPIYLLLSPENPDYAIIKAEIADKLISLRNPNSGEPIASQVLRREEVYKGPFFKQAPDLIFEQGPGVHTSGGVGYPEVFHKPDKWAADNVREGLFLASGPDFASRGFVNRTRIIDLAPTILHMMGLSVPDDVDGQVQINILAPESTASQREIVYKHTDKPKNTAYKNKDEDEIADRLSALGYLE